MFDSDAFSGLKDMPRHHVHGQVARLQLADRSHEYSACIAHGFHGQELSLLPNRGPFGTCSDGPCYQRGQRLSWTISVGHTVTHPSQSLALGRQSLSICLNFDAFSILGKS